MGFGVLGFGFWVLGFGSLLLISVFGVWGLGFGVKGLRVTIVLENVGVRIRHQQQRDLSLAPARPSIDHHICD